MPLLYKRIFKCREHFKQREPLRKIVRVVLLLVHGGSGADFEAEKRHEMVSHVTPLLLGGADGDRGLLKVDSNASPQRLMFFPFFKCPKWLKDDKEKECKR